jgi:hypothetical protein
MLVTAFRTGLIGATLLACLLAGGCQSYRIHRLSQRSRMVADAGLLPQRTMLRKGHLFVWADIQGQTGWFLWDTGADLTVLDQTWAKPLALKEVAKGQVRDAHRRQQTLAFCEIDALTLQGARFEEVGAVMADLSALELCEIPLAGILGQTVIRRANWLIRFSDSTLALSSAKLVPDSGAQMLPLTLRRGRPYLSLEVGTNEPTLCKLDYGSTGTVDLPLAQPASRRLLEQFDSQRYVGAGRGLFGWATPDSAYRTWVDTLRLGGLLIPAVALNLSRHTGAKVGTEVLGRYDAWLNPKAKALWLGPLAQPLPKPEASFGLTLRWVAGTLMIQSLFDRGGHPGQSLRPLQTLYSLQGRRADSFAGPCDFSAWYEDLQQETDTLHLGLHADSTLALTRILPWKQRDGLGE